MQTKPNAAAALLAKVRREIATDSQKSVQKVGSESINEIKNYTDYTDSTDLTHTTVRGREKLHLVSDSQQKIDSLAPIHTHAEFGRYKSVVGIAIENIDENPTDFCTDYRLSRADVAKTLFDQLGEPFDKPLRPFGDFPPRRWDQFVSDARQFLNSNWYPKAQSLGWTITDLFGADQIKPYARIDRMGAVLLINGCQIAAMTETSITIRTKDNATLTIRKIAR
jgi:hypothetical protein